MSDELIEHFLPWIIGGIGVFLVWRVAETRVLPWLGRQWEGLAQSQSVPVLGLSFSDVAVWGVVCVPVVVVVWLCGGVRSGA